MSAGTFKNLLRLASIEKVNYSDQTVTIKMIDRVEARSYVCPLPQPAALNSSGIFISPNIGTTVLVGFGYNEAPFIVSTLPRSAFAKNLTLSGNTRDFFSSDQAYPNLKPGEIAIQGKNGSKFWFDEGGNIASRFGGSYVKYDADNIVTEKTGQHYLNTQGHRVVSGEIKRDTRKKIRTIEEVFEKLAEAEYDNYLSSVGRNPEFSPTIVTSGTGQTEVIRNPGLVENRELTYEFVRDHQVGTFKQENDRLSSATKFELDQPNRRDMVRADVLNLNPTVPNNLVETVKGTLVDRYGNILDINRHKVDFTEIDKKGGLARLEKEDILLRRSIKYHFEINSRKPPTQEVKYNILDSRNFDGLEVFNGHLHSRWSVDVDSEGLTKINIPASSDTGNIPLLTRYVNTAMKEGRNDWSFRDESATDVLHLAFGELSEGGGITIDSPGYVPQNVAAPDEPGAGQAIKYRTAWHDLQQTAIGLFNDIRGGGGAGNPKGDQAVVSSLTNSLNSIDAPNAGGRSIHMNLDGSLELNIGRDSADGKSFVFDSSGAVIQRIGKDFNDVSLISQLDGHIKVQVGGDNIDADQKTTNPSVKFFVDSDSGFHEIEVNKNGIFIKSATGKNLVFESGNNMVFKAAGEALFHAEVIHMYGKTGPDGNGISGERLVERNGRTIS